MRTGERDGLVKHYAQVGEARVGYLDEGGGPPIGESAAGG